MSELGLVGVVVPAFNAERWLAATLDTVLTQTHSNWLCMVVDDGSTDATVAVLQPYLEDPRIRLHSQSNAGLPAARNSGIAALPAECEYLAFLDSDDLWLPNTLEVLGGALQARPDAVGAYGVADYVDGLGELLEPGLHPGRQRYRRRIQGRRLEAVQAREDATFAELVVAGPIWPPAIALQRAAAVRSAGGFDVSYTSQEDWDFYVRTSRFGPYVATDELVGFYRRHDTNMTREHSKSVFEQYRVRRNAYRSPDNTPEQRQQVARAWRCLQVRQSLILARECARGLIRRRWSAARTYAIGAAVCAAGLLRSGPPPVSRRWLPYTYPEILPSAQLLPEKI